MFYGFSYFDIVFVLLVVIMSFVGYKRGILITILNFIRYVLSITLGYFASKFLTPIVYKNIVEPIGRKRVDSYFSNNETIKDTSKAIEDFKNGLPSIFDKYIDKSSFDKIKPGNLADEFMNAVFNPIATMLTKIVIAIFVFVVVMIVVGLIVYVIKKRRENNDDKSKIDSLFGMIFGASKAVLLVCFISFIMGYVLTLYAPNADSLVIQSAQESKIISIIYEFSKNFNGVI